MSYEVDFLNDGLLAEFWAMLGGLLRFISPFIMIGVALILAGWLILLIVTTVRKAINRDKEVYRSDLDATDSRQNRDEKYKY